MGVFILSIFTKSENIIENYHGTNVQDPYRWLENPEAEEVKSWVDEQNEATQDFLSTFDQREEVKERLTKSWNYPKYSVPQKEGNYYYFHKNDGLQNQAVFYRTKDLDRNRV